MKLPVTVDDNARLIDSAGDVVGEFNTEDVPLKQAMTNAVNAAVALNQLTYPCNIRIDFSGYDVVGVYLNDRPVYNEITGRTLKDLQQAVLHVLSDHYVGGDDALPGL